MRDPARIPRICRLLEAIWTEYPDMRFGQLILNTPQVGADDIWYIEDDAWEAWFNDRVKRGFNNGLLMKGEKPVLDNDLSN